MRCCALAVRGCNPSRRDSFLTRGLQIAVELIPKGKIIQPTSKLLSFFILQQNESFDFSRRHTCGAEYNYSVHASTLILVQHDAFLAQFLSVSGSKSQGTQ